MATALVYATDTHWVPKAHTGNIDLTTIDGSHGKPFHYKPQGRKVLPIGSEGGAFGGNKKQLKKFIASEIKNRLATDPDNPAANGYSQFLAKHDIESMVEAMDHEYLHEYKRWLHGDSTGNKKETSSWGSANIAQHIDGADSYISDDINFRTNIQLFLCRLYIDGPPRNGKVAEWYYRYLVHPYLEARRLLKETYGVQGIIMKDSDEACKSNLSLLGYFTDDTNIIEFSELLRKNLQQKLLAYWPDGVLDKGVIMPGGWRIDFLNNDDNFAVLQLKKYDTPACLDPAVNPLMQIDFDVNLIRFPDTKGKGKELAEMLKYAGSRNVYADSPFQDQYHDVNPDERYDPQGRDEMNSDPYGRMIHNVREKPKPMKFAGVSDFKKNTAVEQETNASTTTISTFKDEGGFPSVTSNQPDVLPAASDVVLNEPVVAMPSKKYKKKTPVLKQPLEIGERSAPGVGMDVVSTPIKREPVATDHSPRRKKAISTPIKSEAMEIEVSPLKKKLSEQANEFTRKQPLKPMEIEAAPAARMEIEPTIEQNSAVVTTAAPLHSESSAVVKSTPKQKKQQEPAPAHNTEQLLALPAPEPTSEAKSSRPKRKQGSDSNAQTQKKQSIHEFMQETMNQEVNEQMERSKIQQEAVRIAGILSTSKKRQSQYNVSELKKEMNALNKRLSELDRKKHDREGDRRTRRRK